MGFRILPAFVVTLYSQRRTENPLKNPAPNTELNDRESKLTNRDRFNLAMGMAAAAQTWNDDYLLLLSRAYNAIHKLRAGDSKSKRKEIEVVSVATYGDGTTHREPEGGCAMKKQRDLPYRMPDDVKQILTSNAVSPRFKKLIRAVLDSLYDVTRDEAAPRTDSFRKRAESLKN